MDAPFRELLDLLERHVRAHEKGERQTRLLRDIEAARPEDQHQLLRAMGKALHLAWSYTKGKPRLRAALLNCFEVGALPPVDDKRPMQEPPPVDDKLPMQECPACRGTGYTRA